MTTTSSLPEQCCTIPPFKSTYEPIGSYRTISELELDVYSTGPNDASTALVAIYDIFGMHANTLQGADVLAAQTGYRIVVPDGRPALNAWIQEVGGWEKVRPDLLGVVRWLREEGVDTLGAYGFCFGAKKLTQGVHEPDLPFKALGLVHPSLFQAQDADNVSVPVALLPSGGEDPDAMNAFWAEMQKKAFADKCFRKDFLDVHHGFASARSDWSDPRLEGRAREVYTILSGFFKANL